MTSERSALRMGVRPPRWLGGLRGPSPGATLVVMAGVHGNEPAGVEGVCRALEGVAGEGGLGAGELVALAGNREALARGVRFVDADLNRLWHGSAPGTPGHGARSHGVEAREAGELARSLREVGARARGPVYVLDLHTTSAEGSGFAVVPDRPAERRFASGFGVPRVLGLEELVGGTLLGEVRRRGWVGAVLETGQHDDPDSARRAEAGVRLAVEVLGISSRGGAARRGARWARRCLARSARGLPATVQLRYRHPVTESDALHLHPGLRNFHPVRAGERLGESSGAPIRAPEDGLLLMPLYQAAGSDGFFIVRPVGFRWATALRRVLDVVGLQGATRRVTRRREADRCRR